MRRVLVWVMGAAMAVLLCGVGVVRAQSRQKTSTKVVVALDAAGKLELHSVKAEAVTYRGVKAVRVTDAADHDSDEVSRVAVVKGLQLKDATVELKLTGDTVPGAPATYRGFVGIAFRVNGDVTRYECIYLRPKNGRAEDQLQRNHATQYISVPGYPWEKLRAETPGKYESYVDLVPGAWTDVKVEFAGSEARLYVNGSAQPVLVVHDLKQPVEAGGLALWVGPGTVANFADLRVTVR